MKHNLLLPIHGWVELQAWSMFTDLVDLRALRLVDLRALRTFADFLAGTI